MHFGITLKCKLTYVNLQHLLVIQLQYFMQILTFCSLANDIESLTNLSW